MKHLFFKTQAKQHPILHEKFFFFIAVGIITLSVYGQADATAPPPIDHSYKPLMLKFDETGKKFIRFITWHQIWTRFIKNNPGTLDVNGEVVDNTFDIGIRRSLQQQVMSIICCGIMRIMYCHLLLDPI